jgi:hypothetical protein
MNRTRTPLIAALTGAMLAGALTACNSAPRLPWRDREMITDPSPDMPPIKLETTNGKHLIVMRVPTGGWNLTLDKTEVTPDGRRAFVTARRPDPAFMHTQAFVNLRVLTDVPADTPVEVVARVLDHHAEPDDRVYHCVEPVETLDD